LGVYWHAETQARRHPRAQRAEQAAVVGRLHQECEARPRDRVVVYWNTLQRGLALAVQPSGHRAWKCVYTIRRRGPRWYHLGNTRALSLADARRLAGRIMVQGADPHADRLALGVSGVVRAGGQALR
jgi:hypothetical protein